MPFEENIAQFFDVDDFGEEATLELHDGSQSQIMGIFDSEHIPLDGDGMVAISSTMPVFHCASADVTEAYGALLIIRGTRYEVEDTKPDGTGTTILVLSKIQ